MYALNVTDIMETADMYKAFLMENQRVRSDIKYTIKKIDREIPVSNMKTRTSLKEKVPLYNVDYVSGNTSKGFLLLVGDSRVKNRVIAYSDNSSFREDKLNDNNVLMELIDNYIYKSISETENDEESGISTYFDVYPIGGGDKPICLTQGKVPYFDDFLNWDQFSAPANLLTPLCNATSHTPAGCVALAGAQIMAYHQWPRRGCYLKKESLSSDVSTPVTVSSYTYGQKDGLYMTSHTPSNTISNLCAELGYRCNVIYKCDVSDANLWGTLPQAFVSMGYYEITTNTYGDAKIRTIANELDNGRPVFMIAARVKNGKNVGHAWVVDGVIYPDSPGCAKIHIVYGNGTYNNG